MFGLTIFELELPMLFISTDMILSGSISTEASALLSLDYFSVAKLLTISMRLK